MTNQVIPIIFNSKNMENKTTDRTETLSEQSEEFSFKTTILFFRFVLVTIQIHFHFMMFSRLWCFYVPLIFLRKSSIFGLGNLFGRLKIFCWQTFPCILYCTALDAKLCFLGFSMTEYFEIFSVGKRFKIFFSSKTIRGTCNFDIH